MQQYHIRMDAFKNGLQVQNLNENYVSPISCFLRHRGVAQTRVCGTRDQSKLFSTST